MDSIRLRLPATSANLGPGFDALGLAINLMLDVEATPSSTHGIAATGRNVGLVGKLEGNLILKTYDDLAPSATPLHLRIHNDIPLGMGCGSSAAAILAGVLLANHFGSLHLTTTQVLEEACHREEHPDNLAACFFGGLTTSFFDHTGVNAATFAPPRGDPWRLLLAIPPTGLPTREARALLPPRYARADAIQNIHATALLVSAFALNRPELLLSGTRDRLHQPFRMNACPLLPRLLPLAGEPGIYSVTLSGAGPSVLLITAPRAPLQPILDRIRQSAAEPDLEILETGILHPHDAPASAFSRGMSPQEESLVVY